MNTTTSLALLACCLALCVVGDWRLRRPADPLKPRLTPWRPIVIVAGAGALLIVAHLVNLARIGWD